MAVVGDFYNGQTASAEHAGNFGEFGAGVGQMVHDTDHSKEINSSILKLQVIGLQQLALNLGMVLQKNVGQVELLLAWLGQRYFIGVLFKQQAQSPVAAANVHGMFKMFIIQQAFYGHFFGFVFVVASLPVVHVVVRGVVVLIGAL